MTDARRHAPATERNRDPIVAVLREELPAKGTVLEIASGTGEHVAYFASCFPDLCWRPSDGSPDALPSIAAWLDDAKAAEPWLCFLPAVHLDAASNDWPIGHCDAILCINMVHISPWEATEGLMRGAGYHLDPGAPLILYGPYRRADVPTAPSNEAFDESLKSRDPRWGLRTVEAVVAEAAGQGLEHTRLVEMPANNLMLIFRRAPMAL